MTLRLFKLNKAYVKYLSTVDNKVLYNHEKNTMPYVGVVFTIKNYNYFVPLSSPKDKHRLIKENRTLTKLDNGNLGVLNHNNMIPVPSSEFEELDVTKYGSQYEMLLANQQTEIRKMQDKIKRKSKKLYDLINNSTNNHSGLRKFCCDFKLLEKACLEYEQQK